MELTQAVSAAPTVEVPKVVESQIPAFKKESAPVEAAPVPAETKVDVTPPPEVKPEEKSNERFASLAKKERVINQDRQEMKRVAQQLAPMFEQVQAFEAAKAASARDPFKALEMLGVTYEQLTDYKLNNNRPTPSLEVLELKQEMEAQRRQLEEDKQASLRAARHREQMEVKQTLAEWTQEVQDYVKTNADTYELVSTYNETGLVKALIEEKFRTTKQILSLEDACKLAEKYLEDLADKALATKKLRAKVAPQPKADIKSSAGHQSRTLNNEMTSSAPSFLTPKNEQDRMARALAALDKK